MHAPFSVCAQSDHSFAQCSQFCSVLTAFPLNQYLSLVSPRAAGAPASAALCIYVPKEVSGRNKPPVPIPRPPYPSLACRPWLSQSALQHRAGAAASRSNTMLSPEGLGIILPR